MFTSIIYPDGFLFLNILLELLPTLLIGFSIISAAYFIFMFLDASTIYLYLSFLNNRQNENWRKDIEGLFLFVLFFGLVYMLLKSERKGSFVYVLCYYYAEFWEPDYLEKLAKLGVDVTSHYPYIYQTTILYPINLVEKDIINGVAAQCFEYLPLQYILDNVDNLSKDPGIIKLGRGNAFIVPANTQCTEFLVGAVHPQLCEYMPIGNPKLFFNKPIFCQFVEFSWDYSIGKEKTFKAISPFIDGTIRLPENFYPTSYDKQYIPSKYIGTSIRPGGYYEVKDVASDYLPPRKKG